MKNFTSFWKNIKGWVVAIAVISLAVVAIFALLPLLPQKPQTPAKSYVGVLELWNVDAFEGGSGSRSDWLTARAATFEQTHPGLFVHVTDLTPQQVLEKLDNGETFDVICFSRGVGCKIQSLLQPYSGSTAGLKETFLLSGQVGGKVLALPVWSGAYCLFARQSQLPQNADLLQSALTNVVTRKVGKNVFTLQPLVCGFTQTNSPLSALAMSGGKGRAEVDTNLSQYAAYQAFLDNKTAVCLLGTQRDLVRLSKREELGKLEPLAFCALGGYVDLVQYLGVSYCGEKSESCMEFLQYVTSEGVQSRLTSISMFSVLEQCFYTQERFAECEKGLQRAYVPNVFGDEQAISAQRAAAITTLGR